MLNPARWRRSRAGAVAVLTLSTLTALSVAPGIGAPALAAPVSTVL